MERISAAEVAKRLGIHRRKVYDLAKAGVLPAHRIGGRIVFDGAEVEDFWLRCRIDPDAKAS